MPWSFKQLSPLFARRGLVRALLVLSLLVAGAATQIPVTRISSAAAAEPVKILAFGDSLTAGLGLSEAEAMPTQLNQALDKMGRPALVINGGVSGDTTAGGAARIDWALADKPQIMILALGANDMLRGLDPAGARANLETIIDKAQAAGVEIVLAGMLAPPNLGTDYKKAFDALYPDLAKAHDLLFLPFLLQDVAQQSGLNQVDGMHPNGKGVAVMVQHLLPLVTEAMDRVSKKGAT
jgi:acyl-CoA thioesterase-1